MATRKGNKVCPFYHGSLSVFSYNCMSSQLITLLIMKWFMSLVLYLLVVVCCLCCLPSSVFHPLLGHVVALQGTALAHVVQYLLQGFLEYLLVQSATNWCSLVFHPFLHFRVGEAQEDTKNGEGKESC